MARLSDLVEIIRPANIRTDATAEKVAVLNTVDFPTSGFCDGNGANEINCIVQSKNELEDYDVVLLNGSFKVALIKKANRKLFAGSNFFILRVKDQENKEKTAIFIYMYLKSLKGQESLNSSSTAGAVKSIKTVDLEQLNIPIEEFEIDKIVENFYKEHECYEEMEKIARQFDTAKKVMNILGISMNGMNFYQELNSVQEVISFFAKEGYPFIYLQTMNPYDDSSTHKRIPREEFSQEDYEWMLVEKQNHEKYLRGMKN